MWALFSLAIIYLHGIQYTFDNLDAIPYRDAVASSASRDKLVQLDGRFCSVGTEQELTRYCMIKLCARADVYRRHMLSVAQEREVKLAKLYE